MFEGQPTARADMTVGTLYAVAGDAGWVYYGQVTPEKKIGFFRRRDREPVDPSIVLDTPVMSVVSVAYPSITSAIRAGRWKRLGRFPICQGADRATPISSVAGRNPCCDGLDGGRAQSRHSGG